MSETLLANRYRLDQELGRGGMGIVYRGHDTVLNRPVAIKVLTTAGLGSEDKNRLLNEAQAAARLNHPNLVSVHDAGEAGDTPYIVMELVEGKRLRDFVGLPDEATHLPLPDAISFLRQVCAALEHAHRHGIIHRDLKPENIVITHNQTVKIMDFGLAGASRLTEEGAIVGTFAYLAPEVMLGESASIQSDLYALGVILYELTTGRPPFIGDTLTAVASQHLNAPVVPPSTYNPDIPAALDALAARLLAKRPAGRPTSAAEVLQALEQLNSPEATPAGKAQLLAGLALAQARQSRFEPAIRHWLEAIRLYQELGELDTVARLYARATRAASHGGDTPRSLELCRAGLAALDKAGFPESGGLASLLHEAARAHHFSNLPDEAVTYARQALAMAGRLNEVEVKAEALITVAMVSPVSHSEALAMLREAIQLAEPAGMLRTAMHAYNNLANALEQMGELPSARDYYQQAAELARRRGEAAEELFVAVQAAAMALALGDFDAVAEQLPALKQLRAIAGEDAAGSNNLPRTEGLLFRYRGQWDEGVAALREYQQRSRQRGDLQQLWIANETLAEALLDHNRLAEAEEALLEGLAISERSRSSGVVTRCLLATTYARQGKTAEAEAQLAVAKEEAGPHPPLPQREYLHLAEGEHHQAAGRWTEAIAAYMGAAETQARMGKRWYQATTLQRLAGVHLARAAPNDEQQAQLLMDKARRILRELNIRPPTPKVSPEYW